MKTRLRMLKEHQEEILADFKQGLAPAAICGRGLDIQRQEQCLCVQRIVAESDVEEQKDKSVVIFKKAENVLGFYAYVGLQEAKELQTERVQRIPDVCVIGAQIQFFLEDESGQNDAMQLRTGQLFGTATTNLLHQLKIGVVGVSGTGSIVAEQLARYGVGQLVLVDDDVVEEKNLNRILNSTLEDADNAVPKVQMFERYIKRSGLPVQVIPIVSTVADQQAIHALSQCDILFGCMDSVDGRHHLNLLSSYYMIPYFDVGVKLVADGKGGIEEITTAEHYVRPGSSSLLSRQVYDIQALAAASLKRENPEEYKKRLEEKYIKGATESSPAVISVNMLAASMVVLEMLARLHPYRSEDTDSLQAVRFDLGEMCLVPEEQTADCELFSRYVGKGDTVPLLGMVD